MKGFTARKAVSVLLTASVLWLSAGAECRAAAMAVAKAAAGGGGAPMLIPAVMSGASPAMFQPGAFSAGGLSFSASLPAPAVPSLLPAPGVAGAGVALPFPTGGALPAPAPALPRAAPGERLGAMAAVIQPDLEALQAREVGGEQARGLAERVMASVIGRTQELPLLAPEAPAAAAELESLPEPTLRRLNPKIAVTPVSEHLPGVFFVKFLRATTLEVMLGVLARNGVKPELYADNGDGFRVRVALPEVSAARAAALLAAEGQVESVEVSLRVYDILRRGTLSIDRASGPADTVTVGFRRQLENDLSGRTPDAGRSGFSGSSRHLSMKEFHILNGVGIAVSLLAGVLLHAPLPGLLGTMVAPIPVILAYVGIKRLLGDKVKMPQVRFSPGISWGGKRHRLPEAAIPVDGRADPRRASGRLR